MTHRTLSGLLLVVGALVVPAAYASQSQSSRLTVAKTRANIYVVASKSFCLASGISDVYTGNGKVIFYLTLRNTGTAAGKVNIIPVRHYDDGEFNRSAMDMLIDVRVPGRSVQRFRTDAYTYKAHEHEIEACGVIINNRKEVRIPDIH